MYVLSRMPVLVIVWVQFLARFQDLVALFVLVPVKICIIDTCFDFSLSAVFISLKVLL